MENSGEYIGKWISIVHRYGQSYVGRELEAYNIGRGQYIFLLVLYHEDGISQEEISDRLKIDKATTAKVIKRLEEEGYVTRDVDSEDKRAYKVYITQKALAIKADILEAVKDWNSVLSAGLSADEKELALKLLKKMAENALKHIAEEK